MRVEGDVMLPRCDAVVKRHKVATAGSNVVVVVLQLLRISNRRALQIVKPLHAVHETNAFGNGVQKRVDVVSVTCIE